MDAEALADAGFEKASRRATFTWTGETLSLRGAA
jgi:hypothetical protein